ncbi:hypothetical protein BsWGS_22272 [Bradybaena similaris]
MTSSATQTDDVITSQAMQNGSKETWPEGDMFTWHGTELILIPTFVVSGVLGNTLVLYVYTFRIRTSTVTLIKRMLAGLDLASLLLAQPMMLYTVLLPDSKFFQQTCIASWYLNFSTGMSSNCVLVMIAVDRFMRLCLLSTQGIGGKPATRVFVCSLIFCAVANIPSVWIAGKESRYYSLYQVRVTHCSLTREAAETMLFLVYCASQVLLLLLSLVAILFLYTKIIKSVRHHDRVRKQLAESCAGGMVLSRDKSSTKMGKQVMQTSINVFIAITVLYFVSNLLYILVLVFLLHEQIDDYTTPYLQAALDVANYSPMISSAVDPFIYSCTSTAFRQEVYRILTRKPDPKKLSTPAVVFSGTPT